MNRNQNSFSRERDNAKSSEFIKQNESINMLLIDDIRSSKTREF